jgi:hypothetical protein
LIVLNVFTPSKDRTCDIDISFLGRDRLFIFIVIEDTNLCCSILAKNCLISIFLALVMSEKKYDIILELNVIKPFPVVDVKDGNKASMSNDSHRHSSNHDDVES